MQGNLEKVILLRAGLQCKQFITQKKKKKKFCTFIIPLNFHLETKIEVNLTKTECREI